MTWFGWFLVGFFGTGVVLHSHRRDFVRAVIEGLRLVGVLAAGTGSL